MESQNNNQTVHNQEYQPTDRNIEHIPDLGEDHPTLLPVDEANTPPGTPKLLEISQGYAPVLPNLHTLVVTPQQAINQIIEAIVAAPIVETTTKQIGKAQTATDTYSELTTSREKKRKRKRNISIHSHESIDELATSTLETPAIKIPKRGRPRKILAGAETHDSRNVNIMDEMLRSRDNLDLEPFQDKENHFDQDIDYKQAEAYNAVHSVEIEVTEVSTTTQAKKKRGRKSKFSAQVAIAVEIPAKQDVIHYTGKTDTQSTSIQQNPAKKGRGRPRKVVDEAEENDEVLMDEEEKAIANVEAKTDIDAHNAEFETQFVVEKTSSTLASTDIVVAPNISDMKSPKAEPDTKQTATRTKSGLGNVLKSTTIHRVGLSRKTRIPSLLKVLRK
jgi:hypothetical protein